MATSNSTDSYYSRNKEKVKANVFAWRLKNENKAREYVRTWYAKNKDAKAQSQVNYRKESPLKYLLSIARRRAKKKEQEFSIDLSDLVLPDTCPYLGIPIDSYHPEQDYHPSIDRIDNSKGYIKGNVEVISHRANRLKNDAVAEELLAIALRMIGESP